MLTAQRVGYHLKINQNFRVREWSPIKRLHAVSQIVISFSSLSINNGKFRGLFSSYSASSVIKCKY
jgi:hypothetical protein